MNKNKKILKGYFILLLFLKKINKFFKKKLILNLTFLKYFYTFKKVK